MTRILPSFIELTYYKHNKTYPEQSGTTGKTFFIRADLIEEITPYGCDSRNLSDHCKITTVSGRTIEVAETVMDVMVLIRIERDEHE